MTLTKSTEQYNENPLRGCANDKQNQKPAKKYEKQQKND